MLRRGAGRAWLILRFYLAAVGAQTAITDSNKATAVSQWFTDEAAATATYGAIEVWDVSQVTSAYQMFCGGTESHQCGSSGNTAPEAWAASVIVPMDGKGRSRVIVEDPDADELHTYVIAEEPVHGSAELQGEGWLTYAPDYGYIGEDKLVVVVTDRSGETGTAEIWVDVVSREATSKGCASAASLPRDSAWLLLASVFMLLSGRRRK